MSNYNINGSKVLIAALLGLGALGFSGISAKADVTSQLGHCQAFTKEKVVRCCDQILKIEKKPYWFTENHMTCGTAAVCDKRITLRDAAPVGLAEVAQAAPAEQALVITPKRKPSCFIVLNIPIGGGGGSTPTLVAKRRGAAG